MTPSQPHPHDGALPAPLHGHPALAPLVHALTEDEVEASDADVAGLPPRAKRYYLLPWGTRPHEPVPVTRALDGLEACEHFLLPDLAASTSYPPFRDGAPGEHHGAPPEALLVVTRSGGRFLVGEVDWPAGERPNAGELWRTFTVKEVGQFHELWRHLERR